jgi:hypothetical protein
VSTRLRGVPLEHERRVVEPHEPLHEALLPTLVGLLVRVTPRCRRSRLRSSDEVLSPFVGGDVEVRFLERLLGGGRCLL